MIIGTIIFILVVISVGLIFSFQNLIDVPVTFLFWTFQSPVGLIIVTSFVVGLILAVGFLVPMVLTRDLKIKKLKNENAVFQRRLDDSGILFESSGLGTEGEKYKNN